MMKKARKMTPEELCVRRLRGLLLMMHYQNLHFMFQATDDGLLAKGSEF